MDNLKIYVGKWYFELRHFSNCFEIVMLTADQLGILS